MSSVMSRLRALPTDRYPDKNRLFKRIVRCFIHPGNIGGECFSAQTAKVRVNGRPGTGISDRHAHESHGGVKPLPEGLAQTFSSFNQSHRVQDVVMWAAFRKVSKSVFVSPFYGAIRNDALSRCYPNTLVKKQNEIM